MSKKKVILFIVEGVTDEASLGSILSELIDDDQIRFQIYHGDILTYYHNSANNIKRKVGDEINKFLDTEHYLKKDIAMIIHLIDTDGVFIKNDFVIENSFLSKNMYLEGEGIKTRNARTTIKRNMKKSQLINILYSSSKINTIAYKMYYFSSNLEHVFHEEANVPDAKKSRLADDFAFKYYDKENEFIDFINSSIVAVEGDYEETWDFIKQDLNSINRNSNFHLFFD